MHTHRMTIRAQYTLTCAPQVPSKRRRLGPHLHAYRTTIFALRNLTCAPRVPSERRRLGLRMRTYWMTIFVPRMFGLWSFARGPSGPC